MTDTTKPTPQDEQENNAGAKRPDQGGTTQPGKEPQDPATGADGAAGAGGSKGFGA